VNSPRRHGDSEEIRRRNPQCNRSCFPPFRKERERMGHPQGRVPGPLGWWRGCGPRRQTADFSLVLTALRLRTARNDKILVRSAGPGRGWPIPFALFAKGWDSVRLRRPLIPCVVRKSKSYEARSRDSHPCEKRKDGAPYASSRPTNSRSLHFTNHRFAMICSGRDDRVCEILSFCLPVLGILSK
jgi:hypothetical protein